jgi:hypothetical protein
LQTAFGNQSLTITTDSNTQYNFGTSCQSDNFSCITDGQLLQVKVSLMSGGTLLATKINLFRPNGFPSFQGLVTSANAAQNQFQVVLFFMEDADHQFTQMGPGFGITIEPGASATFSIDSDGITFPPGLSFASVQDIGARVAQEKMSVPLATVRLQPSMLCSLHDAGLVGRLPMGPRVPRFVKRAFFWAVDSVWIDRILGRS